MRSGRDPGQKGSNLKNAQLCADYMTGVVSPNPRNFPPIRNGTGSQL
jgi:hypothetical protein